MKNQKKKKNKQSAVHKLHCPYCGRPAKLIAATGILPAASKITHIYVCSGYPKCDSYVCVHPGTKLPMGTLADSKLRQKRQSAHFHFDKLHSTGLMSKTDAYAWLADRVWLPRQQAHIGHFTEYYCQIVIDESKKLLAQRRQYRRPATHQQQLRRA